MEQWYSSSWVQVVKTLNSDSYTGITNERAAEVREVCGENIIKVANIKRYIPWNKIDYFNMFIQLIFAVVLIIDKSSILALILIASSIVVYSFEAMINFRYYRNAKQIEKLNSTTVGCIRDGKVQYIEAKELVVSDIVQLSKGEVVPADIRIIQEENLLVKENAVTGDNEAVEKFSAKIDYEINNICEIKNMLFKSSLITAGECTGIVVAVGKATQTGKTVESMNVYLDKDSIFKDLRKSFEKFQLLAVILTFLGMVLMIIYKDNFHESIHFIKLSFYAVSFNGYFTLVLFIYFYLINNLKSEGLEIRDIFTIKKIAAISTLLLSDSNFLCDETLKISRIYTPCKNVDFNSSDITKEYEVDRMFTIAALCNNAKKVNEAEEKGQSYLGNNIEIAILKVVNEKNISKEDLENKYPRILELPFDNERGIMTTINKIDENFRANVRGDFEEVIKCCTHIMKNGIEVEKTRSDEETIRSAAIEMYSKALDVVAFAYRNFSYEPSKEENLESNLVFTGLMGMESIIKTDSLQNLREAKELNIKTLFVTDYGKLYSYALGLKLGIIKNLSEIITGIELKYTDEEEYERIVKKVKFFSGASAAEKHRIVSKLKDLGEIIAFSSERFRELPALTSAHITIACGKSCSSTIKNISDMYLYKEEFSNIITLIKKCRKNLTNAKAAVSWLKGVQLIQLLVILAFSIFFINTAIPLTYIMCSNTFVIPIIPIIIFVRKKVQLVGKK